MSDYEFTAPLATDLGREGNEELTVGPTGGLRLTDDTQTSNGIREAVYAMNREEYDHARNGLPDLERTTATSKPERDEYDPGGAPTSEGDEHQAQLRRSERIAKQGILHPGRKHIQFDDIQHPRYPTMVASIRSQQEKRRQKRTPRLQRRWQTKIPRHCGPRPSEARSDRWAPENCTSSNSCQKENYRHRGIRSVA